MKLTKIARNISYGILLLVGLHFFLRVYTTFAMVRATHIKRRLEARELLASDFCSKSRVFVDCAGAEMNAARIDYLYLHALEETLGIMLREASSVVEMRTKETFMSIGMLGLGLLSVVALAALWAVKMFKENADRQIAREMYSEYVQRVPFRQMIPKTIGFQERLHLD